MYVPIYIVLVNNSLDFLDILDYIEDSSVPLATLFKAIRRCGDGDAGLSLSMSAYFVASRE